MNKQLSKRKIERTVSNHINSTYVYHNPLTEVVVMRNRLKVGYASELGVGGVPVLFLAAELGQRPETNN